MNDSLMILGSVWNVVWTVLCFLFAIAILIAVHEYGHFITARLCGVKVLRFSLGFGKVLCSFKDRLAPSGRLRPYRSAAMCRCSTAPRVR